MGYECDKCGACCKALIIEIEPVDLAREPRLRAVARPFRNDGPYFDDDDDAAEYERIGPLVPGFEAGASLACGASYPCPMLGGDGSCSIYATRPTCCVAFQAGSNKCQDARAYCGLQPLVPKEPPHA